MENTKIIGGKTYSFGFINPEESIGVQVAIMRVVGEPLFKAFMDSQSGAGGDAEQAAAGAAAIGLMMSKMDAPDLIATMKTVFKYTGIAGEKMALNINADFIGQNKTMWQVFLAALRFNYSDFLPDALLTSVSGLIPKSK